MNRTTPQNSLCRLPIFRAIDSLLLVVGLVLFTAGAQADHRAALRFGGNLWIGYVPFYLAQQQGLYDSGEAHALRLIQLPSASDVLHAFRNDRLEVAAVTLDEALRLAAEGTPFRIVLLIDISKGADALLGGPGIDNLNALRAKRIGVEDGATGAILLHHALLQAQLTAAQVSIVPLTLDRHVQALRTGLVDAVVTFDPARAQLLASGAHLLFDSSKTDGSIVDLLIVTPDLLKNEEQRTALTALIEGYFSMLAQLQGGNDSLMTQAAADLDLTPDQFRHSMQLIEQPDRARNCALLCGSTPAFDQRVHEVADIMETTGLLPAGQRFEGLITDEFVTEPTQ